MNDSVTQESLRSYLVSLVCETDFVNHLGPVKASLIFLSLAVLPPEGQQRWRAKLHNQWRGVFAALPASQQPSFGTAAFATAVRAGQIEFQSLTEQVVAGLTPACRERLKVLGTGPDEGPAYRETMLTMCLTSLLHHWRIAGETRLGLERFDRLPDLLALAHARGAKDVYAEQERLAREHDAQKKPYRLTMPQRHPGRPCSSGAHTPPAVQYTLVNPARNEKAELSEAELHEAREHGAELPVAAAMLLANLSVAD